MALTATINGFQWNLTTAPPQSQGNAYLLWTLYLEILSLQATYPIVTFSIVRAQMEIPAHFHATVTFAAGPIMKMHAKFVDPLNPGFTMEMSNHDTWRWHHLQATRGLRDAVMRLLTVNQDLISDALLISVT